MNDFYENVLFYLYGIDGAKLLTAVASDAFLVIYNCLFVFNFNGMLRAGADANTASDAGLFVDLGSWFKKPCKLSSKEIGKLS